MDSASASGATAAVYPAPFDARSMGAMRAVLPIGPAALARMPHLQPRSTTQIRNQQNTADNDGGGQAGYIIPQSASAGDGGITMAMTAYDDAWVTTPTDGSYNTVNAPTTHGPNGNCIEIVTNYYNGFGTPGTTVDQVQFYDFCANGGQGAFVGAIPMDGSFVRDFVRVYADPVAPLPRYVSAVVRSSSDNKWHAYLYNATLMKYVDYYDSVAGASTNVLGGEGWSIFETHYHGGDCAALPNASVTGLSIHTSGGWRPLDAASVYSYSWGTCFSAPLSDPYYVPVFSATPNVAWNVTSAVAPALSTYARTIRADAPAVYYRLGDNGPWAIDSSGTNLTGTWGSGVAHGMPSLLASESSDASAQFGGGTATAANAITAAASTRLAPAKTLTIEAWVRPSKPNPGTTNDLVAYGSRATGLSYTLQMLPNNTVAAFVTTVGGYGLVTSRTALSAHQTYLLDATYDGAKLSISIDGALEASAAVTGPIAYALPGASNGLSIGAAYASSRPVFAGQLDEVAVYPSALSAARIAAHWTAGAGIAAVPAVAQYASVVLTDAPLAFFQLNDNTRTAFDAGSNHLSATYGSAVIPGVAGLLAGEPSAHAAQFPGGTSSAAAAIEMPRNAKLEPAATVGLETWIEPTATSSSTVDLISYGPQPVGFPYTLQLLSNRTVELFVTTRTGYGAVVGKTSLALGTVHLIDGTYDGTTLRVFVDGVLDGSASAGGALNYSKQTSSDGLSVGTAFSTFRPAFAGVLSNVAIYATPLSPARIAAHWIAGSGHAVGP